MKTFKKVFAFILMICIFSSVSINYAAASETDIKNAITLNDSVSSSAKTMDVNFKIPEGLSGIQGIEFEIILPEGFTVLSFDNSISKFDVTFKSGKYIGFDMDAATTLESIATPVNGYYKLGAFRLGIADSVVGKNYTAKVIIKDITATNSKGSAYSNLGNTLVNRNFTYEIACTNTSGHKKTLLREETATFTEASQKVYICENCGKEIHTYFGFALCDFDENGAINENDYDYFESNINSIDIETFDFDKNGVLNAFDKTVIKRFTNGLYLEDMIDLNNDGLSNMLDLIRLKKRLEETVPYNLNYDLDYNSRVNSADLIFARKFLFLIF